MIFDKICGIIEARFRGKTNRREVCIMFGKKEMDYQVLFVPRQVKKAVKQRDAENYSETLANIVRLRKLFRQPFFDEFPKRKKADIIRGLTSFDEPILIFYSTKELNAEFLDAMKAVNPKAYVYIKGGMKFVEADLLKKLGKTWDNYGKDTYPITYFLSYSIDEMKSILQEIEKIESWINPNWTNMQKFVFLYDYILSNISFDPQSKELDETFDENKHIKGDLLNRSLRGLFRQRAVCFGHAVILNELLRRQDIDCMIQLSETHAWVVPLIDGKFYNVDLTYDSATYKRGVFDKSYWIGKTEKEFLEIEAHKPTRGIKLDGKDIEFSVMDKKDFSKLRQVVNCPQNLTSLMREVKLRNGATATLIPAGAIEAYDIKYYRYIYKDTKESKPRIIFSCCNFADYMYACDCNDISFEDSYLDIALNDLNKDGFIQETSSTNSMFCLPKISNGMLMHVYVEDYQYERVKGLQKNFYYFESDGVEIVAIPQYIEEFGLDWIYNYKLFRIDPASEFNRCVAYTIRTERTFSSYKDEEEKQAVVEKLFSIENLKESVKECMGYVGSIEKRMGKFVVVKDRENKKRYDSTKTHEDESFIH